MASSVCCTVGTTLEMATPVMRCCSMPRVPRIVWMNTPYSSAVCSRRVVSRQDARRRGPLKTPILVLVFPTSMTSSMDGLYHDFARHDPDQCAAVHPQQQGAVGVEVDHDALASVRCPRPPADALGALEPGRADRGEPSFEESPIPAAEGAEKRRQQLLERVRPPRLDPDRGRHVADRSRKVALVDVEADAEDDVLERPLGRRDRLGQYAADLPLLDHDVVGPADRGVD